MSPVATFLRQTSAHRSKTRCMYTLASSGEATAPCGVPSFVSDHWPSSDTPAFSHFSIRRSTLRSGHPMLDELHRPFVAHGVEEAMDVGIEHPVHPLPLDAHRQRVQRLMRAATRTEPVRKAP